MSLPAMHYGVLVWHHEPAAFADERQHYGGVTRDTMVWPRGEMTLEHFLNS